MYTDHIIKQETMHTERTHQLSFLHAGQQILTQVRLEFWFDKHSKPFASFSRLLGSKMVKSTRAKAKALEVKARHLRVPLTAREVQIIRRLKAVIKLLVTKIALAVGRNMGACGSF